MIDFVHTYADGSWERVRKTSPTQTRRGAEAHERELRAALEAKKGKKEETNQRTETKRHFDRATTLRAFAEEYMRDWAPTRNKPSVLQDKRKHLDKRLLPAFGDLPLAEITARRIDGFKAQLLRDGLANNTINNFLVTLGSILSVAVEWDVIVKRPKIEKLTQNHRDDFLDFSEAARLLSAAKAEGEWWMMILLGLRTGLRRGELIALRWQDIDVAGSKLVVRQAQARKVVGTPKGKRAREIPLSADTLRLLDAHRHGRGLLVFCDSEGKMFEEHLVVPPLRRARKLAGLRQIGWHTLRHTFASHLVMKGVPLRAVQELLGHASITTTMRYAHLAPRVAREAVDLLEEPAHAPHGTPKAHGERDEPEPSPNPI